MSPPLPPPRTARGGQPRARRRGHLPFIVRSEQAGIVTFVLDVIRDQSGACMTTFTTDKKRARRYPVRSLAESAAEIAEGTVEHVSK